MIQLTPVESSNVAAVGYDAIRNALYVKFHSGQIYRYHGVPVETYEAMMAADSIGSFYHKNIKRNLQGEKVELDVQSGQVQEGADVDERSRGTSERSDS